MVGKLCVWVFKTIFLNYLTIPTYVPNLEVLLTAKTILILNHPTSGVNWVITIWFGQHTLFYIIKQKYDNIQYKKIIYMYY